MALGRSYRVFQKYVSGHPFSLLLENARNTEEFLLFESGIAAAICRDSSEDFKKQYEKVLDAYGCLGVLQLHGASAPTNYLVVVTACVSVGKIGDCDVYRITGVQFLPMWQPSVGGAIVVADDRILEIQKLISSGTFYFPWAQKDECLIDLSLCAQRRMKGHFSDTRFFWNRTLHLHLQRFGVDTSRWLLRVMCGGIEIKTVYVGHKTAKTCLISRLSCERAGTRFNVRGTNDYGHVANFVETEQVIYIDDQVASFVQTRGSVPLFWEQPGVQVGSHKVKMSRGFEASAPAYDRHFRVLKDTYGRICAVNLLGSKEGESMLSQAFKAHHENSIHAGDIPYILFDYHSLVRATNRLQNLSMLWEKVKDHLNDCGVFFAQNGEILREQTGIVRTNCLDCLDRTNTVQSYFAMQMLVTQLSLFDLLDKPTIRSRFEETYKQMWALNGDHVSKIYAGTGALEFRSKFKDGARSVTRTIQNNLMDGSKQEAIDCFLLGSGLTSDLYDRACNLLPTNLLHACPNVLASMVERVDEYTTAKSLRVFCGTWNVNGGQRFDNIAFRNQSIADWLISLAEQPRNNSKCADIYAIGLEEIVDLNASNIMSASSTNQRKWAEAVKKCISRDHKYVMITSVQLVGVCLFVFVRPQLAPYLRDVGVDMVKTGLGGATGNKGGVAIRFVLHSTSLCFLCAHFAAGQSQIGERNADFAEICRRVKFPMGRGVFSHDIVFWMGDFNYRVDMPTEKVKQLIADARWELLIDADQLTQQRLAGHVFDAFREGPVRFPPTYKYDIFSDDYDTSEKCRTPAWTDRVLWWQRPPFNQSDVEDSDRTCKLIHYGRAELKTSDHRPVGAVFEVAVREMNDQRREEAYHAVVGSMGPPDATVLVSVGNHQGGAGFPMDLMDGVLHRVAELCVQVLLVKFVGQDMWLIFKDGEMALAALSMDGIEVDGYKIFVRLRSPMWENDCDQELVRCRRDTENLFNNANYSLLADEDRTSNAPDFVQYEVDVDDEVAGVDEVTLDKLTVREVGRSPSPSGRNTPTDLTVQAKAAPPPRPGAPPKRPPPPKASNPASMTHCASSGSLPSSESNGSLPKVRSSNELAAAPNAVWNAWDEPPITAVIAAETNAAPEDDSWADFAQSRTAPVDNWPVLAAAAPVVTKDPFNAWDEPSDGYAATSSVVHRQIANGPTSDPVIPPRPSVVGNANPTKPPPIPARRAPLPLPQ